MSTEKQSAKNSSGPEVTFLLLGGSLVFYQTFDPGAAGPSSGELGGVGRVWIATGSDGVLWILGWIHSIIRRILICG